MICKSKKASLGRLLFAGNNYNNNLNGNNNLNNNGRFVGIAHTVPRHLQMRTYTSLWEELCSYKNLETAFKKARKHKTLKPYVIKFQKDIKENLFQLKKELLLHTYKPRPLKTFILRDPKTRKISKSDFRDRVIHHTLINIIESLFEKSFIYDSYANRKYKGTLKAIQRFNVFKRKVSKNNKINVYVLKADIKHYFETVDHEILLSIIKRKIKDEHITWLIKQILNNFNSKIKNKGMPLGNLTSQFFANVYLNELDYFVKHTLKAKYYIRYVDDFIILHENKQQLLEWKDQINNFLKNKLKLELHPDKSKIINLNRGVGFLGLRVFYYHKLLKKSNIRKIETKLLNFKIYLKNNKLSYDKIYSSFEGWLAYAHNADTYKLRAKLIKKFESFFPNQISSIEVNRYLKYL